MSLNQHTQLDWRGDFSNTEVNALHAEAFETRLFDDSEWNWQNLTANHSLGWVTARVDSVLVGFVNVIWDGLAHAWIQDVMVSTSVRRQGVGVQLVRRAIEATKEVGCEWLHVDFDESLRSFYHEACGFTPTNAGLMQL